MRRSLISAVLSLSVLLSSLVAAQTASYTFTNLDIPSEGGNNQAFVFDINNTGQVVGYYNTLWPDPAGTRGFLYDHGTFTTLHHPDAALGTLALGINDAMQIVGHYVDSLGRSHGFVYDHGVYTTIDRPGSLSTELNGINNAGHMVRASDFGSHGFVYRDGTFTSIDVPGGFPTAAVGINQQGQITGVYNSGGRSLSFLYDQGVFTTITVPGATTTNCFGINDQTQISGNYNDSRDGLNYGFMYDHEVFTTLNPPGSIDRSTFGINDNGQIVGYYVDTDGVVHNFVTTPVVVDKTPPTNMATTPFTLVGNSADSPAPPLRPSPATGHAAEMLDV
jgi:probable HAF family extracellular repeat protein